MSKWEQMVDKTEVTNKDDVSPVRIDGQHYIVFSYASPKSAQTCNTCALKIRGCFATEAEAKEHASLVSSHDVNFDVWVMPMWKWVPFPPQDLAEGNTQIHYEQQSQQLADLMQHINNEKSGRNKDFIERMQDTADQNTMSQPPMLT